MASNWRVGSHRLRVAVLVVPLLALHASSGCNYYTDDLVGSAVSGAAQGAMGASPSATGGSPNPTGGSPNPTGGSPSSGGRAPQGGVAGSDINSAGSSDRAAAGMGGTDGELGGAGDGGYGGDPAHGPIDACPNDSSKLQPGQCGCGVPETCAPLKAGLVHRYSFNQDGAIAVDSVGGKNGAIVSATASLGKVSFDGTTEAYVDLPNGIVSSLHDASFEVWLQWGGGAAWQRIFDFGDNDKPEGSQGSCATYLYLCPKDGVSSVLRGVFTNAGGTQETIARGAAALPIDTTVHVVLVADDTQNELRLYVNGVASNVVTFTQSLSSLNDVNNWLGRSNCLDPPLKGSIDEFRIYGVALDAAAVKASYEFGPNPTFLSDAAK